ncbi:hypothetical protein ES705_22772 [subsurface metagenome]
MDRWWNKDEKIELGIEEEVTIMTLAEFEQRVKDTLVKINGLNKKLKGLK